jgi:hypothetical protein
MMKFDEKNKRDTIELNGRVFIKTLITFEGEVYENKFSEYDSKTLGETSKDPKYKHLKDVVNDSNRDIPFGQYLFDLKKRGDKTYLESLNYYGDKSFCEFEIQDESIFNKKGLYVYCIKKEIKYIGMTIKPFKERINNGYGRISPKNCYKDGQSTNCHLNHLVAKYHNDIELYVHSMESSDEEIENLEKELITQNQPEWNRQKYK